jgi:hypothetical protein
MSSSGIHMPYNNKIKVNVSEKRVYIKTFERVAVK